MDTIKKIYRACIPSYVREKIYFARKKLELKKARQNIKTLLKEKLYGSSNYEHHPQYIKAQAMLAAPGKLVDLGCGASPHHLACAAVDKFIAPEHRGFGFGQTINTEDLSQKGIRFINADIAETPFEDKEFDTLFCNHVIEHVDDPIKACKEAQRIAMRGVFFAQSIFAEIAFGRPYHRWFVSAKENTLLFIEKDKDEYMPFGSPSTKNPFDKVLNDGYWYKKPIWIPSLRNLLRKYWYSHHPAMEVVFTWEGSFKVVVVRLDGTVQQG